MDCAGLRDDINKLKALQVELEEQIDEVTATSKGNKAEIFEILKEAETDSDQILEKYVDDFFEKNPDLLKVKLGKRIEGFEGYLSWAGVNSIIKLPNNNMLIGGDYGALYEYQSNGSHKLSRVNSDFNGHIYTISVLTDKTILVGGFGGLWEYQRQSDNSYKLVMVGGFGKYSTVNTISALTEEEILVGGSVGTLYKCEKQGDGSYKPSEIDEIDGEVTAVSKLPNEKILIGGKGILSKKGCLYELRKQEKGSYELDKVNNFDDWVNTFYTLSDDEILIGGKNGLYEYKRQDDDSYKLNKVNGINDDVKAIFALPNGNILIGGEKGALYECQWSSDGLSKVRKIDGFNDEKNREVDITTISKLPNGNILIGGKNGALYEAIVPTKSVETLKQSLDEIVEKRTG